MEKRRHRIEGQKKANLRKLKTYGLASALLSAGVLATVVGPDALANNTTASSTNQTTVHYRYATLDELSSTEKQSLVKALPKSVTEEATYYLVYRPSTLPKTNSIASPLAVLLGLGTLVIAVKVGKSGRKTAIYMATLTAVAGLATASTVYAVSTNVLGKYNRDLTLTVGSDLPDGKLTLSGYEFVGYLPGAAASVTTTTTSAASTTQATTTTSAPATTVATTEAVTTKVATTTVAPTTAPSAPATSSSSTTTVTTEAPSTTVTSATTEAPTTTVTSATTEAPTTTVTSATTEATSSTTTQSTTESTTTKSTTTSTTTKATTTTTQATTSATIATATPKMGISLGENPSSPVKEYTVTLNQATVKSEAMTYLKQLRLDMYNNINPKFNGTDLRSYLASIGITSAEQYASSFTWDETLERIAIQRALETGIGQKAHARTNSSEIWTATDYTTGKGFNGEIIQYYYGIKDALTKSDGFAYGELSALNSWNGYRNDDRSKGSVNGHLYTLLDPANKSYGFANIVDSTFPYGAVTLGVSSTEVSTDTSGGTANGTYTLNYAID